MSTKKQIESLNFKVFSNNNIAFNKTYGLCYGNNLNDLLANIRLTIFKYHLSDESNIL